LVLSHDEETWDCPKREILEKKDILKHNFEGRMRGAVSTCGRKP